MRFGLSSLFFLVLTPTLAMADQHIQKHKHMHVHAAPEKGDHEKSVIEDHAPNNPASQVPTTSDKFFLELSSDPLFPVLLTATWRHGFSETDAIETSMWFDPFDQTLILHSQWAHSFGNFSVSPGIGTTFGTASWNVSLDPQLRAESQQFVFRDIMPVLGLDYADSLFEASTFNLLAIPIQESQSTALWLGLSRASAALKWNEAGVGPLFEILYFRQGPTVPFQPAEIRIGGQLFKRWDKSSFQLFLGYNLQSVQNFLGVPIVPGAVWRGSFTQEF